MTVNRKKFIVFKDDTEIFKYIPEDDDRFLEAGTCILYDTLKEAQAVAIENAKKRIMDYKYKDFK